MANFECYCRITYEHNPQLAKFNQLWIDCNKRNMTTNPNKIWTSQMRSKFTFALSLLGPSLAIINNVMYLNISCLIGDTIEIYWIFTLCKILAPFVSIILTSLENFKCCLKLLNCFDTMWRASFRFYPPYGRMIMFAYNELLWSGGGGGGGGVEYFYLPK